MKLNSKKILVMAGIAAIALAIAEPSFAQVQSGAVTIPSNGQSIGKVAQNLTNSLKGVSVLITMVCYLGALVFGLMGALKWKAYGEQPDRTPFKIPVIYWGIAVLLAGFPEFLGTGISTLWGTGAGGSGPAVIGQP